MNGVTRDAACSIWMKCPVVHRRQPLHLAWRTPPSHCYKLYLTHFVLLGYFINYKFRLCASKWIYPTAVYLKSDKRKVFLKNTVLPVRAIAHWTVLLLMTSYTKVPGNKGKRKQQRNEPSCAKEEWT